jgi:putative CocE/NonD family hydrolase
MTKRDLLPVLPPEVRSFVTSDGVRLDADVYRPAVPGDYPVLVQRQAYGRRIACAICYAHPSWYAANGYIVMVQDVRGRGTSEGVFRPGEHEATDGAETIEWAARLPGSTGQVGTFGFSYQAYNQLLAATGACPSLKAMIPAMGPWHAGRHWMFENAALRLKQAVGWGVQITAEAARRAGDVEAYGELLAAGLPVDGPVSARPDVLMRRAELSHFADWIERRAEDPFWDSISPATRAKAITDKDIAILIIGGWFDTHFASTLAASKALAGPRSRFLVGPWAHFPWTRKFGQVDFGRQAELDTDRLQIDWFDRWLKGVDTGVEALPPIRLFDVGEHGWRDLEAWPQASSPLYLGGGGRAAIRPDDGVLLAEPAPFGIEPLVHDPWRPAPAVGGAHGTPPGPVDRAGVESRGDVLVFTGAPVRDAQRFTGPLEVELLASADQPSFDLACTLSRQGTDGKVIPLANGYARAPEGEGVRRVRIALQAICVTLKPGECLRLSVAGASFPAFPVNPGSGADPASTPRSAARITTITLHCGGEDGSRLLLPEAESTA